MIIAIEGIDGSGKSTVAKLLAKELNAKLIEQADSKIGSFTKSLLSSGDANLDRMDVARLFTCARNDLVTKHKLKHHTTSNDIYIFDRYIDSTLAYGTNSNEDIELVKKMNLGIPTPDLIIRVVVDPKLAMERINKNRLDIVDYYEDADKLIAIDNTYIKLDEDKQVIELDGTLSSIKISNNSTLDNLISKVMFIKDNLYKIVSRKRYLLNKVINYKRYLVNIVGLENMYNVDLSALKTINTKDKITYSDDSLIIDSSICPYDLNSVFVIACQLTDQYKNNLDRLWQDEDGEYWIEKQKSSLEDNLVELEELVLKIQGEL